jgi:hypothetical protein
VATALLRHVRTFGPGFELDAGTLLAVARGALRPGPRAQLRWSPSPPVTLSSSFVRTHQFAQSLRNAESIVGHVFPVDVYMGAGAAGIGVARSDQGVLAAELRPLAGVRLGLQGYARRSTGVVQVAPRDGEPFSTGGFAVGSARSRGVSVEAAAGAARWAVVASYGVQRVRYQYGDSSYVPDHGAAQLLEAGVIAFPTATTSVRVGLDAAFGRRTTIVPGGLEWESYNILDRGSEFVGTPHYGGEPLGTQRLPDYVRLDLGVRQHLHVRVGGRDAMVEAFATFTNLLDRGNLLTYARDPATGQLVGIELRSRGPLVFGLDWKF